MLCSNPPKDGPLCHPVEAPIQHRSISDREVQDTPLYAPEERYQKVLALIHSASNPRMLRTCHHVVPPTTLFIASSRPNAFIRHTAASSQEAVVITRRATRTRCRDRSRTFTKFFECVPSIENWKLSVPTTQESLTGLSSYVVATSRKSRYDIERRIIKQLISSEGHGGLRAIADNPGEIVLDEVFFLEPT